MASPTGALCLVSAMALVLSMVWHGSSVLAAESRVAENQEAGPVIGCVDARATYVLTDQQRAARHTAKWRATVERRGRCFAIEPGAHWERIVSVGGLMLMRRTPPEPGVPPLYFRFDPASDVPVMPEVSAGSEEPGATDQPAAVTQGGLASKPVPKMSLRPTRMVLRTSGEAGAEIRMEDMPPLPGPVVTSVPPASVPPDSVLPASGPAASMPVPVLLPPPAPAEAPAVVAVPLDQAPLAVPQTDGSPTSSRSYAIGFGLVIVLIALLLAAMVLMLRFLLRWSPRPERPVGPVREPMLSPAPSGTSRPIISRIGPNFRIGPDRQRPVVHRPASGPVVPAMLQAAGLPPGSEAWMPEDRNAIQRRCVLLLREAGWDASGRRSGQGHADVVARRDGRVMALLCLPGVAPVDEQSVEEACMARERERADVAVIVSNTAYTAGARRLAVQTGVDLLHEDELRAFAR